MIGIRAYSAFLYSLAFVFCFAHLASAQAPPNAPQQQFWVTDQADILDTRTENMLTSRAQSHEQETTDQVVVVTVNTLDGWTIERYGRWLGNTWGIGQADRNNGVLLLVAPNERQVRIEVGVGLERVLTNSLAQQIIDDEILPRFRDGDFEAGIVDGHRAIISALGGTYEEKSGENDFLYYILLPLTLLSRLLGFGGGRFSGGGGSFGGGGASGSW